MLKRNIKINAKKFRTHEFVKHLLSNQKVLYDFPFLLMFLSRGWKNLFLYIFSDIEKRKTSVTSFKGGQKENFSTPHTCWAIENTKKNSVKRMFMKHEYKIHPFQTKEGNVWGGEVINKNTISNILNVILFNCPSDLNNQQPTIKKQ